MSSIWVRPWIDELLAEDQPWLSRQPVMQDWSVGCHNVQLQLTRWLHEYSSVVLGEVVAEDCGEEFSLHIRRLWICWRYHWKQAAGRSGTSTADGWYVGAQLQEGRGSIGRGNLGGNPLRDVVLTQGVGSKDAQATELFLREYQTDLIRLAENVSADCRRDENWWGDFIDDLAGYSRPPGRLAKYLGMCGLRNWLGTVVKNYVTRRHIVHEVAGAGEELAGPSENDPVTAAISSECLALLIGCIQRAVEQLDCEDRLILQLRYGEHMSGKGIAGILNLHPGNVSRKITKAIEILADRLRISESQSGSSVQECIRGLFGAVQVRQLSDELLDCLLAARERL